MTTYTVTKISELTNLAAVPEDTDELVINDATVTKAIAAGYLRRFTVTEIASSGAQATTTTSRTHIVLNHASAINLTLSNAPTAGDELTVIANTTANHTVIVGGGVTWNGSATTATLNATDDSFHAIARSATRWDIISNNSVTLS